MNTVDALNALGKALCGDSFEVKPGLTDAETILEIAKNYTGGGSGGGGARIIDFQTLQPAADDPQAAQYESGLTVEDFANAYILQRGIKDNPDADILTDQLCHIPWARKAASNDYIIFIDSYDKGTNTEYWYYPATGHLKINLLD